MTGNIQKDKQIKLIEFKDLYGKPIYINPEYIVALEQSIDDNDRSVFTYIYFAVHDSCNEPECGFFKVAGSIKKVKNTILNKN